MGQKKASDDLKIDAMILADWLKKEGPRTREEIADHFGNDAYGRKAIQQARLSGHPIVSIRRSEYGPARHYKYATDWDDYRPFRAEMISRIRAIAKVVRAMDSGMKYLDPTIVRLLAETSEYEEDNE